MALASSVSNSNDQDKDCSLEDYVEIVISRFDNEDFLQNFRMGRSTFQHLIEVLAPFLPDRTVSVERKLLSTLWLLSTQESFRSVADRFRLSKGRLHQVLMSVCHHLVTLQQQFIRWPQAHELQSIADGFYKASGFPGVVGAIDGAHIIIPAPQAHRNSYLNKKGYPSIQLQAVCDTNLRFLDIYTGWPGSVSDARIFKNCPLQKLLSNSAQREYHLVGDSDYCMRSHLMVPFRDSDHLTEAQQKYNSCHSAAWTHIERAFALLKSNFQRMRFLDMRLLEAIPVVIGAACVLHNFILEKEDIHVFNIDEIPVSVDLGGDNSDLQAEMSIEVIPAGAVAKRIEITNRLA